MMKSANLLFMVLLIFLYACKKDKNQPTTDPNSTYQLELSYEASLGDIVIEPLLDKYQAGAKVKITAKPKSSNIFKNWEINSKLYPDKEITLIMEKDYVVKAEFTQPDSKKYTIAATCETSQGSVSISPLLDQYPSGTSVTITAIPKDGYAFSNWEGISSTNKTFTIDVTQDYSLKAIFKKDVNETAVKLEMELNIELVKNNKWTAQASISDVNTSMLDGVANATVAINGKTLKPNTNDVGSYSDTLESLNPGDKLTVTLEHSSISTVSYNISVPPVFTNNPSLTGNVNNNNVTLTWESINCSEYKLYKKIENSSGSYAIVNIYCDTPLTNNTYATTVSNLLTSNISMYPNPNYYMVWVRPANVIWNLQGLANGSYIQIVGKSSNGVTNKPK